METFTAIQRDCYCGNPMEDFTGVSLVLQ